MNDKVGRPDFRMIYHTIIPVFILAAKFSISFNVWLFGKTTCTMLCMYGYMFMLLTNNLLDSEYFHQSYALLPHVVL